MNTRKMTPERAREIASALASLHIRPDDALDLELLWGGLESMMGIKSAHGAMVERLEGRMVKRPATEADPRAPRPKVRRREPPPIGAPTRTVRVGEGRREVIAYEGVTVERLPYVPPTRRDNLIFVSGAGASTGAARLTWSAGSSDDRGPTMGSVALAGEQAPITTGTRELLGSNLFPRLYPVEAWVDRPKAVRRSVKRAYRALRLMLDEGHTVEVVALYRAHGPRPPGPAYAALARWSALAKYTPGVQGLARDATVRQRQADRDRFHGAREREVAFSETGRECACTRVMHLSPRRYPWVRPPWSPPFARTDRPCPFHLFRVPDPSAAVKENEDHAAARYMYATQTRVDPCEVLATLFGGQAPARKKGQPKSEWQAKRDAYDGRLARAAYPIRSEASTLLACAATLYRDAHRRVGGS